MADQLTDRQREVLELFVASARDAVPAPTYAEICNALDFSSTCAAFDHVTALCKKGWLERGGRNRSRSLLLTNHARRVYGLPARRAA